MGSLPYSVSCHKQTLAAVRGRWPTLPRSSADEAPCPGSVHASVVCPQATHRHGECSGRSTRASVTWVCRATLTGEQGVPDRAPGEAWVAAGTQGDGTRRPPGEQRCHLIFIREPRGGPGSRAALLSHHLPCSGRAPWGGGRPRLHTALGDGHPSAGCGMGTAPWPLPVCTLSSPGSCWVPASVLPRP